ncbi:MAG: hypothetical protein KBI47_06870, partial [Armatimonadetes bacterium]|nr:hypothetical protein [Armatimonadota bacterium]
DGFAALDPALREPTRRLVASRPAKNVGGIPRPNLQKVVDVTSSVPWGSGNQCWYPMTTAEHQANKDAWLGWSRTGMEMCYRPNHLLGYTMPNLSTRQVGDMIRFAGANGMAGFDYDSLLGQWAVRGPMLYVHMRLGTDPTRTVDQIREEYFSAFGPAASKVEAYCDYWEDYSTTKALHGGADWGNCSQARKQYPPEAFGPAEALIDEALELAATSELPEFAARVRFLQAGLEHARLAANFVGLYEDQQFPEARQALLDLAAFRRAHEKDFIADYLASATTESRTYPDLESLWDGNMLVRTDSGALAIPPGAHKYSDGYARNSGKPLFGPIETAGLRPSLWGFVLDPDQEGHVIHRFRAADGYVFKRFEFMPYLALPQAKDRTDKTYNKVEFSKDGKTYETLYENVPGFDPGAYWNLTHKAQGLNEFYIRISAGFPGETWLVYQALNIRCGVSDSVGFAPGMHQLTESFALAEEPGDLYPVEVEGLRRSKWGYAVEPDQEGYVTHRFRAAEGCVFESFEFMPWLMLSKESDRTEKTYNKVEFSEDGREYKLLHENAQTYRETSYWDLTDRVRGLGEFYVRISVGFPRKTALAYVRAAAKFEVSK